MAHKTEANFDATHALYHRTLGMTAEGRKPKFWLGPDQSIANRRAERLELLWAQVEADWQSLPNSSPNWEETEFLCKPERPYWDDVTLAAAKAIAKGENTLALSRKTSWSPYQYTLRIARMQQRFPAIQFVPVEEEQEFHNLGLDLHRTDAQREIQEGRARLDLLSGRASGQTWHQALDAYAEHLAKLPDQSGWYHTQIKQTQRLKENHPDLLLAQLGLTRCEEFIDFWRHRPTIKDKIIAATTARNQIIQLGIIWKWLHRNDQFAWKKPDGLEDIKQQVKGHTSDPDVTQVEVFSLEDLKVLWGFASPLVRLEMLLGLNCGFKEAEIGSLAFKEIYLGQPYPGVARTNRPVGIGNWICRLRRKTKVYGEWTLWPSTVAGLEWAIANRKHEATSTSETLMVTRGGHALDARTNGGNKSDKIYSSWTSLYRTIEKYGGAARYLPFKSLEKTATDWLRSHYDGEIASMFSCHGKPVKNDAQLEAYSNKPYPRLFGALDALGEHLRPILEGVTEPWRVRATKMPPATIAKVKDLRSQGMKMTEIAEAVGLHPMTVGKLLRASPGTP